jgi:hypothetical protein
MKYKNGEIINYAFPTTDNSEIKGIAKIVGYSTQDFPNMGRMWIVEDQSGILPLVTYPFKIFCCPESCITKMNNYE